MLEAPGEMDPAAEHVELERADQLSNHRQKRNVDEANTGEYYSCVLSEICGSGSSASG